MKFAGATRWYSGKRGGRVKGMLGEFFSECLCQEIFYIEGQVGRLFQISGKHCWRWHLGVCGWTIPLPPSILTSPLHTIPSRVLANFTLNFNHSWWNHSGSWKLLFFFNFQAQSKTIVRQVLHVSLVILTDFKCMYHWKSYMILKMNFLTNWFVVLSNSKIM